MSDTRLPELHSRLIGGFVVLDKFIRDSSALRRSEGEDESYIDLGFGFNKPGSRFCGIDRISIVRDPAPSASGDEATPGKEKVTVVYAAMACNPSENRMPVAQAIQNFHSFYAMYLFREGLGRLITHHR
jgi:hypothetical protein